MKRKKRTSKVATFEKHPHNVMAPNPSSRKGSASMKRQKVLLQIRPGSMTDLAAGPETGMEFYVAESSKGLLVILENSDAMPINKDPIYFCLEDLLQGVPVPDQKQQEPTLIVHNAFASRPLAVQALQTVLTISPAYVGTAGAIPLIAKVTLPVCTMFVRYISSPTDHRFNPGTKILTAGTYLTSQLDRHHADTGFGSVGRYALPLPIPVTTVIEYTLPTGTDIEVGTVAPLFGQAGGGVEIKLVNDTVAHQGFTYPLPPY